MTDNFTAERPFARIWQVRRAAIQLLLDAVSPFPCVPATMGVKGFDRRRANLPGKPASTSGMCQ